MTDLLKRMAHLLNDFQFMFVKEHVEFTPSSVKLRLIAVDEIPEAKEAIVASVCIFIQADTLYSSNDWKHDWFNDMNYERMR